MKNAEWYVDWFNSPYYHLLYRHRDHREANFFIDNLCDVMELKPASSIWDLACGQGRHSIALHQKGFKVTGTDLSANNIKEAKKKETDSLKFEVHDMRAPFLAESFDAVFNLFTSIGYFRDHSDNQKVFDNVARALRKNGEFVIDFFNARKVLDSFQTSYSEERNGIRFEIGKRIENSAIIKRIEFSDQGHDYYFEEFVSLLTKNDFENFAHKAGMSVRHCFGNYQLAEFNESDSERLIMIFRK